MNILNNPKIVKYTPVVSRVGFEIANIGFIIRMFHTHSSRDQNLISWVLLFFSLLLWANFYRVCTPDQWPARITSIIAAITNFAVLLTVIYFRLR